MIPNFLISRGRSGNDKLYLVEYVFENIFVDAVYILYFNPSKYSVFILLINNPMLNLYCCCVCVFLSFLRRGNAVEKEGETETEE